MTGSRTANNKAIDGLCKRHKWHCEVCQKADKCCECNTYLFKQCYDRYNSANLLSGPEGGKEQDAN